MGDMEHVIDQGRRWSESPPGDLEKLESMIWSAPWRGLKSWDNENDLRTLKISYKNIVWQKNVPKAASMLTKFAHSFAKIPFDSIL